MNRVEAARELEVPLGASADAIERAFRRAARRRHPDLGGDPHAFRRATEARAIMLRPPPVDAVARVVGVVIRFHPTVRALSIVVRAFDRRSSPRPTSG